MALRRTTRWAAEEVLSTGRRCFFSTGSSAFLSVSPSNRLWIPVFLVILELRVLAISCGTIKLANITHRFNSPAHEAVKKRVSLLNKSAALEA